MQLVDNNLKEDALELFRSKKVIVVSGPRGSGKTTLALSLLSSYQEGHYLILTEPEDTSYIRFGVTCVVVIEDLGGKYSLEMPVVLKWLRKFDMLYSAVKDGKLNIIITCVPDKLKEYIVDASKHPILEAVFTLPKNRILKIKQEPSADTYEGKHAGFKLPKSETNQFTTAFTRVKTTTTNKMDEHHFSPLFCQHPDGSFLVLQYDDDDDDDDGGDTAIVIHHFSSDFQYIRKYNYTDISDGNFDICCTDSGDVVIDDDGKVTLYRITDGTIQNIKSNSNAHEDVRIVNLCFFMNRIYITCDYCAIVMLDTNLNVKKKVNLYVDFYDEIYDFIEMVPCVMQKYLYIHPIIGSIICDDPKKKQKKCLQVEGFKPQRICAASEDSVFVVGRQGSDDRRILQVNTDMEILSDIPLKGKEFQYICSQGERIVFDKVNARLIFSSKGEAKQIYLE